LFGQPKPAEELGLAYALGAGLEVLAALAESGTPAARAAGEAAGTGVPPAPPTAAASVATSGGPPSAKRFKPNPPAAGDFEEEIFGEERVVRVEVRDENAPREMRYF
jgi:hypothetical protein